MPLDCQHKIGRFESMFALPEVTLVRCSEFTFHHSPEEEARGWKSIWNCDGEIVEGAAIQVRVHRRAVRLFGSGPRDPGGGSSGALDKSKTMDTILSEEGVNS